MDRFFFISGAVAALIGVALGAFGAHSLRTKLSPEMLGIFEVGVRYQMYHAFGLIAVAWAMVRWPEANLNGAGWAFIAARGSRAICGCFSLAKAERCTA